LAQPKPLRRAQNRLLRHCSYTATPSTTGTSRQYPFVSGHGVNC